MVRSWNFLGAEYFDWAAGFVVFVVSSLFVEHPVKAMPMLLALACVAVFTSVFARKAWFSSSTEVLNRSVLQIDFILQLLGAAAVIFFAAPSEGVIVMIFLPILIILGVLGWRVLLAKGKD